MKALTLIALLFCASAAAQQPDPNQYLKDPVPHPAPAHPAFHFTDDSKVPPATFSVENGCRQVECFIFFNDEHGNQIVRISERTGKVTVAHPERMDEAARRFWLSVTRAFGQLHCAP